jgi:hypothetical protein
MKNSNKEPMKLTKSRIQEPEAGGGGQRRVGTWVRPGLSGQEVGKQPGFAHIAPASTRLGPDNSTQVVDFPRIESVGLFWGRCEMLATDGTPIKHGWGQTLNRRKLREQRAEETTDERRMDTDMTENRYEPSGAWKSFRTGTVGRLN